MEFFVKAMVSLGYTIEEIMLIWEISQELEESSDTPKIF